MTIFDALEAARALNEPGEINAEYVRGQANLICDMFGLLPAGEWHDLVTRVITHRAPVGKLTARIVVAPDSVYLRATGVKPYPGQV